jgi:hypothetical protein
MTQDEKTLLERAARAAGIEIWTDIDGSIYCADGFQNEVRWNPLADDGDALRLAVKLRLTPLFDDGSLMVFEAGPPYICVAYGNDINAATRLAIVRAAAATLDGREG